MARLCVEGSNADEPLNVPLSDYSSDEGVSDDDDDVDDVALNNRRRQTAEGCCCSTLPVPPTSPVFVRNALATTTTTRQADGTGQRGTVHSKKVSSCIFLPSTFPRSFSRNLLVLLNTTASLALT